jgi:hypothetical protein
MNLLVSSLIDYAHLLAYFVYISALMSLPTSNLQAVVSLEK